MESKIQNKFYVTPFDATITPFGHNDARTEALRLVIFWPEKKQRDTW